MGRGWHVRANCENPRVVEGLAERGVDGWAAVCTAGEPNLVVDTVLGNLSRAGADLYYHGDFDWPGIAIANRVITRFAARPWRMTTDDYLHAVRPDGPAFVGKQIEPACDPELGRPCEVTAALYTRNLCFR